ncbi:MAG: thioredoxin [Gemmatimonadetes bacterium]|nr:thioredoxin [Gemmatimonadota bacterium]
MAANTLELTDQDFDAEVKNSDQLALVDFWASWCGPCRMIAPIVDELAEEYQGKLKVYKLDVDANPKSTSAYSVRSIPSILFFKGGTVVDSVLGAVGKNKLKEKIDQHI